MKRIFLGVLCVTMAACSSSKKPAPRFDHFEYSEISVAPSTAKLEPNSVTLAEGVAVKALVKAIDERGKNMSALDLESGDPTVVGVEPGPEAGSFVFYAGSIGATELHVISDETQVGSVPVQVVVDDTP